MWSGLRLRYTAAKLFAGTIIAKQSFDSHRHLGNAIDAEKVWQSAGRWHGALVRAHSVAPCRRPALRFKLTQWRRAGGRRSGSSSPNGAVPEAGAPVAVSGGTCLGVTIF